MQLVEALSELIEKEKDRAMIIDLGPSLGNVDEKIEFLGADQKDFSVRNAIIV